jgi:hypothetical protein
MQTIAVIATFVAAVLAVPYSPPASGCTPATYDCAVNAHTGKPGWKVCDVDYTWKVCNLLASYSYKKPA